MEPIWFFFLQRSYHNTHSVTDITKKATLKNRVQWYEAINEDKITINYVGPFYYREVIGGICNVVSVLFISIYLCSLIFLFLGK